MTSSITWRRWRGTSCGRGLRKKSLDSNQRKSASTASPPLRRSSPCRLGEPGLTPPARRLQEDADPAEGAQERPTLLGGAVDGVGRLEGARKWWAAKDSNLPPTDLESAT